MSACRQQIKDHTGITFTQGKTDLYNYLPFKLHELLEEGKRLGIILSNSWLGTEIGKRFFDALQYYYEIRAVVISNCGRWFQNADVVATLLILQKKEIIKPDQSSKINFWMLHKDIEQLTDKEKETIVSSVVLEEELDRTVASVKQYSIEMIQRITDKGIT